MTTSHRPPIDGAWRIASFAAGDGATKEIDGVLLLADGCWSTLYFLIGASGTWGSGESGRYEFDGATLTFFHRLAFQGGGGRELYMTRSASHVEPCGATLTDDALTIRFPSGTVLVCHRMRRRRAAHGGEPMLVQVGQRSLLI